jgi:cyanophycinase
MSGEETRGPLALIGGDEWLLDDVLRDALAKVVGTEVLLLPTAAAFERPERAIASAEAFFAPLGARVQVARVFNRTDAEDESQAKAVRDAACVLLVGRSPLHLRSVLKDSAVLNALFGAWRAGATIVGSAAGAMALTDPMVDPRGGAFTVGLGLVRDVAVVPHHHDEDSAQFRRTLALTPSGVALVGLPERTVLVRDPSGVWRAEGAGAVEVFVDGVADSLAGLAGKPVG